MRFPWASEREQDDQTVGEVAGKEAEESEVDDSPELRLQALFTEYARERAALAEQVSQLQEENERLKQRVQALEQVAETRGPLQQADVAPLPEDAAHPEHALGLDFSLPEG